MHCIETSEESIICQSFKLVCNCKTFLVKRCLFKTLRHSTTGPRKELNQNNSLPFGMPHGGGVLITSKKSSGYFLAGG